jgi:hypothetical protein
MELGYGKGRILLFGFKPQFRGQSHATYKYLFNELYVFDHPALPAETPAAAPKGAETATVKAAPKPADEDDDDWE